MAARFDSEEPFGHPDGSSDSILSGADGFVEFPSRFGGISRDPSDARVRVVVGPLGSGKSLQLRRMRDVQFQENSGSSFAIKVEASSELSTESVLAFAQELGLQGGNTELWKLLWRRAITRSAISHLLFQPVLRDALTPETRAELLRYGPILGRPEGPRKVTHEAQALIRALDTEKKIKNHLYDARWSDIDHTMGIALRQTRGLFLYVDDVDKNFRWAPALWIQCQRGLFYAIMDLLRDEDLRSDLHVVVALRDIAFSSIRLSEHASRYLDYTHINILSWNRESMTFLLEKKLEILPDEYFLDATDRSIGSWLGLDKIRNSRPSAQEEGLTQYMIRHTGMVPRDLISLGNSLCHEIRGLDGRKPSDHRIREIIAAGATATAQRQITQCANQVLSDIIPVDASKHEYEHVYLRPNEYAQSYAQQQILQCMELTQGEVVSREQLTAIDETASHLFDAKVNLCDILWQQGLLGVSKDGPEGVVEFFSLESHGSSTHLPRSGAFKAFVWNSLVFDLDIGLQPVRASAAWPR